MAMDNNLINKWMDQSNNKETNKFLRRKIFKMFSIKLTNQNNTQRKEKK